jgi:hypothetical protein
MGLKAPFHQTRCKFVGAVVGMTNPLQVCGCINGHEISRTPITKKCNNTLGAGIFFIVITRKHELSTTIITKKKKVGFLKCLMLQMLVFLDIYHQEDE